MLNECSHPINFRRLLRRDTRANCVSNLKPVTYRHLSVSYNMDVMSTHTYGCVSVNVKSKNW